jgi:hypothetical protein
MTMAAGEAVENSDRVLWIGLSEDPWMDGSGRTLEELLRRHAPDAEWAEELHELRRFLLEEDPASTRGPLPQPGPGQPPGRAQGS